MTIAVRVAGCSVNGAYVGLEASRHVLDFIFSDEAGAFAAQYSVVLLHAYCPFTFLSTSAAFHSRRANVYRIAVPPAFIEEWCWARMKVSPPAPLKSALAQADISIYASRPRGANCFRMDGTDYMIDLARGQFASADAAKNPIFLFHCSVLSSTVFCYHRSGREKPDQQS
jgi:hypothetical protein